MAEGNSSSSSGPVVSVGDTLPPNLTLMELESENKVLIREIAANDDSKNTLFVFLRHHL